MSARACPWRQKPPDGFEERVAAVSALRMFLLQETGPTSFVIKEAEPPEGTEVTGVPVRAEPDEIDEAAVVAAAAAGYPATASAAAAVAASTARSGPGPRRRRAGDDKFKVQIGSSMKCSCKSKGEGPCKHLLFVLLKILRVPQENPFLWQDSLLDHEIDQVLRGRYQVDAGSKRRQARKTDAGTEGVAMKPIEAGDVCAICQEDLCDENGEVLTDNGPMVFCKQSCGNSVHAKCMKVWAEHKSSVGEKITCPFCREDWGPGAVETIKKEIRQSRRPPNVHYGVTCCACKAGPITGNRFRCLICADFDLCERCFSTNRAHAKDGHPFVSRPTVDSSWMTATRTSRATHAAPAGRGGAAAGESAVPIELIEELQSRELGVEDYDLLLQLDAAHAPIPLHQHLAAALERPSESDVAAACARGDGLCGICSTPIRMGGVEHELRKAPCGTVLHLVCLQSHIAGDSNLLCPCCSDPLFNGLRPPGRAPARPPNAPSHARATGAAALSSAAPHSRRGAPPGAAPQLHTTRDRSPAPRLLAGGTLAEAGSIPGFLAGMAVTGRHVGLEHGGGEDSEAGGHQACGEPAQLIGPEGRGGFGPGRSRGRAGAGLPMGTSGHVGVAADGLGLTPGERMRAEPASAVNARLQRARRDARATSLDPVERSAGPLVDGMRLMQVSSRHLAPANLPPVLPRTGEGVDNDDFGSGQDTAAPVVGAAVRHDDAHAPTPAAAAAAAAEARLVAASGAATDDSAHPSGSRVSPRTRSGGPTSAGVSRDLPTHSSSGGQAPAASRGRGGAASGRPPRAEAVLPASGLSRGPQSHRRTTVGDRPDQSLSFSVGGDGLGGEGGQTGGRGRSTSGRAAGGHGAPGRAANVRRGRSSAPSSGAPGPADAASGLHGMQGIRVAAGGSRTQDQSQIGGGSLPELVSPGVRRPGSEPTGAGRRAGGALRGHDGDSGAGDHLDLARSRMQERERKRERTGTHEQMKDMVLGGSGLGAGLPGKVGRHARVGRKHLGGGQLRPLNQRAEAHGAVLMYETTLS